MELFLASFNGTIVEDDMSDPESETYKFIMNLFNPLVESMQASNTSTDPEEPIPSIDPVDPTLDPTEPLTNTTDEEPSACSISGIPD
mmetsp:Transcript_29179/g.43985  ORF Transcript_29179/g.43985 Transcript_29179/m.43985 type:complete len:87 (-) Transcript_29179:991-1251(-)